MKCNLNVVSPENIVYFGLVNKIKVSGDEGELGIYPGHLQLLSFLKPGTLYFLDNNDKQHYIYLSGGIIEINPKKINILTDVAFRFSKLDKKSIIQSEQIIRQKIQNSFIINKKKILKELSHNLEKIYINKTIR
ncbi:ATP synthase F1 subunit epsilon [Buchnera aphidicola]|uniref:ATP synthase epsilon chain n=1 Tax=Buchnera aphidicola subsp. Melaphis rhois TaxID=118103 RepID=A0A4D6Y2Z9_BUCMH|nr:ATP synthase F1 subunit epsilon [Buchnera aphidicola]QCI23063.1 ATP synthase F1 subunit epsilon [Buchnera aphidicola (Melaphis rhois)]